MGKLKILGDVVEGGLNAIRSAGRAAHEQQAAVRAARDAEVAEQMANLPARNKKANEALGLYHPVGGGLKLSKPTRGMHSTTVADPKFNPPKINDITPEQLVKEEAALFPLVGDRAAGGKYLTHVGENELEAPVRLTGGPLYMDANYNHIIPDDSAAWESGLGRVTALGRQAERAGEGGRPVYGIYTAGSGTNTDFNIMGANALIQQIPYSKITKKAEKEFDRAMREGSKEFAAIPDWPGIRSPEAQAMLLDKSNGIARTKLFDTMGKENFQSMGFPDVPATRKAIIEPELLDIPTNQSGFRMARMDTKGRIIEDPNIPSDYPAAMAGKVAGKLDVPADYKDVFQSHFDARRLLGQPESGDYYSFSRAHPIQYADDAWLNRLMEQRFANERKIKEGGYKKGGAVEDFDAKVDKLIEKHHFDNHINNRIEEHFAKGGMPKLARTSLRMAGGGLLGKGAKALAGAMKGAEVMPAVEREANLAKFLEPSKVPERLYHGTTATEGGKGTEAIRRIKPSKEGALGSGVYMTPNQRYANMYGSGKSSVDLKEVDQSGNVLPVHAQIRNPLVIEGTGDPMIEALTKLGMEEDKAARMVERAYEEKGYIGKQVESRARAAGYDGLMQYRDGELSEVVSYNPNAVKSAIGNQGTYDINHPDLSKSKGGVILKHTTLRNRGETQPQPNGFKEGGKSEATVQATPRNKYFGAASDALKEVHEFASKPFGYSNPPVEFISELLGIPASSRVLDKLSYGEPITNYGKANVPLIPDDTFDAFTAGLGGLGSMSKLAKPLAKAAKHLPKDLPVGLSIKAVDGIPTGQKIMPTARIGLEAPGILIPSKMNNVREAVRNMKGNYGARRVERAADEIPNLERMYQEDALKEAFTGDNASAMMSINPSDFEKFARELERKTSVGPKASELAKQGDIDKMTVTTDEYIKHLQKLKDGFSDVPYLNLTKDEVGLPTMPQVIGHEGRHRNRALADAGEKLNLVKINPRGDLREGMPRRTQEDYIEALKEELERSNRLVLPETDPWFRRPEIQLPDIYAKGGAILKHHTLRNRRANQRVR